MVDGQVAHTPTSYHKYYHPTMPLNFFVTSLVTSSPTLCTCLSTITSMTSVISPITYLYYCHHSHQHQYSFYSPTMSLTSSVSSLEKFQWKNHKVVCFYQPISKANNIRPKRSDVGSLPELPESPSNCLCRHHLNNINHLPQNSLGSAYCTHCAPMSAQLPAPTLHSTPW